MTRIQEDNVIDNKKIILKNELHKILPKTDQASIAVGYFFISGFASIINSLKNTNKIRLLISNTTDKKTSEALIEGFRSIRDTKTNLEYRSHINSDRKQSIIKDSKINATKSLEYMEQTHDDVAVVEILLNMMKSKKLEVRIYPKEKLHAKAYIFQLKNSEIIDGLGIVGSSNLSIAGISHNSELNLKTSNSPDVNQLLNWFDNLWKDGLEFTEDFQIILQKSWAGKIYSPYEVFLKGAYHELKDKIDTHYELDPIWAQKFPKLFPFQEDAVNQSLSIFDQHGGIIIGDVVGLGKTYVGTALLKYLQLEKYRPLIVCPPGLINMWERFCTKYEIDAKYISRGKLSMDNFQLNRHYKFKDRDLVLIDESHHLRNNNSRQYENLSLFMASQDAKAILLTATPFANNANDIKNQIMLFHQSAKTTIPPANETDLDDYFRKVAKGQEDLTEFLRNIMVRRTRRYVINQWGIEDENKRKYLMVDGIKKYFPDRKMKTQRYNINEVYQQHYQNIVNYLDKEYLTFARYSLGLYVKEKYRENKLYKELQTSGVKLVALMKHLLLKRMESSLCAFKDSINRLINTHKIFLTLLDENIIPIGDVSAKMMYEIAINDPDSLDEPKSVEEFRKKIKNAGETKYKISAFDIDLLKKDIKNDIETFNQIYKLIDKVTHITDDKLIQLQKLLDEEYKNKKILVFTEFTSTAQYLSDNLKWKGKKVQVDSSRNNALDAARKFDPENNPSDNDDKIEKNDEISLLISTDVLSEGVNLQAGQVIINYDFHWNPIRLIQRAGRVDRIGSKNEFITVHNFLPDPIIESDLGLQESVAFKINEIQRIIGEDYKILSEDEQINENDIYVIYDEDDSIFDKEDINLLEPSKFEKILKNIQINDPEYWEEFKKIPDGIRSSKENTIGGSLLLACESDSTKSGNIRKYYLLDPSKNIKELTSKQTLRILESEDKTTHGAPSNYTELVSIGWKKFLEDVEQINARSNSKPQSTVQKWILEKLMKIQQLDEFSDQRSVIATLHKAFSTSITKGRLNRELRKIMNSGLDQMDLIKELNRLYIYFELQKQIDYEENEVKEPRILYSQYVGKISIG